MTRCDDSLWSFDQRSICSPGAPGLLYLTYMRECK